MVACHLSHHTAIVQTPAFEANLSGNMFVAFGSFFIYFSTLKMRLKINRIYYTLLPCF